MGTIVLAIVLAAVALVFGWAFLEKDRHILKILVVAFSSVIVLSFFLGFLDIPLKPISLVFFLIPAAIALLALTKPDFKKIGIKISKTAWVPIAVFVLSVTVGIVYFRGHLNIPQYYSLDAASHFLFGEYTQLHEKIIYFDKGLYFPDAKGLIEYPFGSAVITATAFQNIQFVSKDSVFQMLNIIMFALVNTYAYYIFTRKLQINRPVSILLVIAMQTLGFFFNLLSVGFFSQVTGLFLVLGFLDIYIEHGNKPSWQTTVLLSIIITAILFTYYYWLGILVLFLIAHNVIRMIAEKKDYPWAKTLGLVGITVLLAGPYLYALAKAGVLSGSSADGTSYKVFLLNFILLLPFIAMGVVTAIKKALTQRSAVHTFILACLLFTGVLYVLYHFDIVSSYTFTKSYYLTGPILFFIAVAEIQTLASQLKGLTSKIISVGYAAVIAFIMIIAPFQKNVDCRTQGDPVPGFPMNTLSLDGRLFDIFYFNIQSIVSPTFHRYNLDSERIEFMLNLRSHLPAAFAGTTKLSVVTDYDTALWFYVKTGIWPRSLENGIYLFEPELVDYAEWRRRDTTGLLVVIGSNETDEWITRNGFHYEDFQTLYSVGDNYLLQRVN